MFEATLSKQDCLISVRPVPMGGIGHPSTGSGQEIVTGGQHGDQLDGLEHIGSREWGRAGHGVGYALVLISGSRFTVSSMRYTYA